MSAGEAGGSSVYGRRGGAATGEGWGVRIREYGRGAWSA
jgi:hypothetical protein